MSTEITIKEAAEQLNISEQRTRTLCRANEIKARKLGSSWVIDASSLRNYGLKTGDIVNSGVQRFHQAA